MDNLTIGLRTLHIVFGTFWAGTTFFNVLILEPQLRRLGHRFQHSVMNALMPVITPLMMVSSFAVLGTGIAMTFMNWSTFEALSTSTTGWILVAGFIFTMAAIVVGLGFLTPTGIRLGKLSKSFEGREPNAEELQRLSALGSRIEAFSRLNFVFILLALTSMVLLRY